MSVKKQLPIIQQFARDFQVPTNTLYIIILIIVSISGLYVLTSSVQQQQLIDSSADSSGSNPPLAGCNEACTNNRECRADHFCFQGHCRLASNSQSPTCAATTVTPTQATKSAVTPVVSVKPSQTLTNPTTATSSDQIIQEPTAATSAINNIASPTITENETHSDLPTQPTQVAGITQLIQQLFAKTQATTTGSLSLPVLLGAGLIGLLLLIALVIVLNSKKSQINYQPTDFDSLEQDAPEPVQVQTQTQAQTQAVPLPLQSTQAKTQSTDDHNIINDHELTPPPSAMISRIQEKKVEIPKRS